MKFWHLLVTTSMIWLLSEVILAVVKRSASGSATKHDRSSLRFLWLTIIPAISVGVYLGKSGIGHISFGAPWSSYLGFIFILLGLLLRWSAILTLRRYFTVDVAIAKDHKIVDRGLYKYVRHPAYSGALLSFLGLGLAFANWMSVMVIVVPTTGAFMYRIKIEEAALRAAFGDEYVVYCRRTKRLIPKIY